MNMVNLATGQIEETPNRIGNVDNPNRETLLANGHRDIPSVPDVEAGYVRGPVTYIEGDGITAQAVYQDRPTAEIEAEQAAATAAAEYQASLPVPMPTGIEAPVVVLTDSDGKGWGVVADGGDLVTYPDHASPRPDAAVIAARQAQARADSQAHKARIAAIKTDLDQVEAALDQVDVTTTGVLGVAIAATTGVNKTALQEVRKVLVDLKVAAKNLRQASEKVRREIR